MSQTQNELHEMATRAEAALKRLMIATGEDAAWIQTATAQHDIVRGICVVRPTRSERWDAVQALEAMVADAETAATS